MAGLIIAGLLIFASALDQEPTISAGKKDADGFVVHEVQSPYQAGKTQIRVLLPDRMEAGKRCRVIYLLPVEAGRESVYGDGLIEAKKRDLHNKYQVIFVAATFSHLPWYADHPTRAEVRQESYFLQVVLPFIEKNYPVVPGPGGRWLLGFSKSGWGAFSLLLRHPDVFGKAAAWDAPLMMAQPNRFGMGDIFGTQANFEKYQITRLLEQNAARLKEDPGRLILLGYGSFRDHHQRAHALMTRLGIAHQNRDGPAQNMTGIAAGWRKPWN